MSCYNGAKWLSEAIESVLAQTFADFEFIIVDDGSTDETAAILRCYSAQDTRIVIVAKPNTGLSDSLNVGIRRARAEWIARLDADDICEPTRLEKQLQLARESPKLVFVGTGLSIIDEEGTPGAVHRFPTRHAGLLHNLTRVLKFPPHSSAMYRTSAVRSIGGYRVRIRRAQDFDLWLRLSALGDLACIDEPLVRIRQHPAQVSHEDSGRRQQLDSRVSLVSYWLRLHRNSDPVAGDEKAFDAFRGWIERRLEDDAFYLAQDFRARLRGTFYQIPSRLRALLAVSWISLRHPRLVFLLVRYRLQGETLARKLASEWTSCQLISRRSTSMN